MSGKASGALRGSIGIGIATLLAYCLVLLGFRIVGVVCGGAVAGAFLAWKRGNLRLVLVSAFAATLALFLGGSIVLMSFFVLAYSNEDRLGLPSVGVLLEFYSVFIIGFTAAGATLSAVTASRLVSLKSSVKAFAAGGVIGGAIITATEFLKIVTPWPTIVAVTIAVIIAGALCGASLNSSEEASLSIV